MPDLADQIRELDCSGLNALGFRIAVMDLVGRQPSTPPTPSAAPATDAVAEGANIPPTPTRRRRRSPTSREE